MMTKHAGADYLAIRAWLNAGKPISFFTLLRFVEEHAIDQHIGDLIERVKAAHQVYNKKSAEMEYWRKVCGPLMSTTPIGDHPAYSVRADIVWWRRYRKETYTAIAKDMGISISSVRQLKMKVDAILDRALTNFDRCDSPYVYGKWFHFGPGEERLSN